MRVAAKTSTERPTWRSGLVRSCILKSLPSVLRVGPYRFFFYSPDGAEPIHIHGARDSRAAKFWLEPVRLSGSKGFGPSELRDIERVVDENQLVIVRSWNEFFAC